MTSVNEPISSGCFEGRREAELAAVENLEPSVLLAVEPPDNGEHWCNYSPFGGAQRRPVFRLFKPHFQGS